MKKLALLMLGVITLVACNSPKNNSSENSEEVTTEQAAIGGEQDDHGCLIAAGEVWSELQQNCVQIFNIGQRLNPIEQNEEDAVLSAFVLFSEDSSQVELFLPDEEGSVILNKDENDIYQNDTFKFDSNESALYKDNEKVFQSSEQ